MAVVWLARPRVNIQHVLSRSHMRACVRLQVAASLRDLQLLNKPLFGSVGIQVRRLRPMANLEGR